MKINKIVYSNYLILIPVIYSLIYTTNQSIINSTFISGLPTLENSSATNPTGKNLTISNNITIPTNDSIRISSNGVFTVNTGIKLDLSTLKEYIQAAQNSKNAVLPLKDPVNIANQTNNKSDLNDSMKNNNQAQNDTNSYLPNPNDMAPIAPTKPPLKIVTIPTFPCGVSQYQLPIPTPTSIPTATPTSMPTAGSGSSTSTSSSFSSASFTTTTQISTNSRSSVVTNREIPGENSAASSSKFSIIANLPNYNFGIDSSPSFAPSFENSFNAIGINNMERFAQPISIAPTPLPSQPEIPKYTLSYAQYLYKYKPDSKFIPKRLLLGVSTQQIDDSYIDPSPDIMTFSSSKSFRSKSSFLNQQVTYRQMIFKSNLKVINQNNQNPNRKYIMGLNRFTDIPPQQFTKIYSKLLIIPPPPSDLQDYTIPQRIVIDWRCKVKSPVFQQGNCGCCYAVSAVDAIHLSFTLYRKMPYPSFSVQQIVSCGYDGEGILGCSGGYLESAFSYVEKWGIGNRNLYQMDPRAIGNGTDVQCAVFFNFKSNYLNTKTFIMQDSERIRNKDCAAIVEALKTRGIAVGIVSDKLQFYQGGTYVPDQKKREQINHAVLLVGYHPDHGYLIRNSWGVQWGDKGYGFIGVQSGVCQYAMYPKVRP